MEGSYPSAEKQSVYSTVPANWTTCARGAIVIVVENGHGDLSSNPGRSCLHFTYR